MPCVEPFATLPLHLFSNRVISNLIDAILLWSGSVLLDTGKLEGKLTT